MLFAKHAKLCVRDTNIHLRNSLCTNNNFKYKIIGKYTGVHGKIFLKFAMSKEFHDVRKKEAMKKKTYYQC